MNHERTERQMNARQTYQVMPPLSPEEYAALKADIAARGVQVPVEYDDEGNILDGFHRVQICQELGLACPQVMRSGLSDAEKRAHAWKLNLTRRHLSKAQKRAIAKTLRGESWTQERIAQALGLSQATISNWLTEVINSDELHHAEPILGKDGKRYPHRKARPGARQPTDQTQAECEVDPHQPVPFTIPNPQGVKTRVKQQSREAKTDATPSMPERSGCVLPDDASGRVRALMDELYALIVKPQHPGGLRALTEHWSATMKQRYHDRCGSLSERLRELQAVLATPADDSVPTVTIQAIDDVEAGKPECDAIGACPKDLLNGHDDHVMPPAVLSPIAHAAQEHRKRKLVTVSSAEDPVAEMTEGDPLHLPLGVDGKPPANRCCPLSRKRSRGHRNPSPPPAGQRRPRIERTPYPVSGRGVPKPKSWQLRRWGSSMAQF
jgi:transposase-like protein